MLGRSTAIAILLAGCSFEGAKVDPEVPNIDAAPIDASSTDAAPLDLIDDGLLVRYFVSEAASGGGATLVDAAAAPFDLPLAHQPAPPQSAMSYCEPAPRQRGLCWSETGSSSRAVAPIGSKLLQLEGTTEVSIEVVVDIEAGLNDWSRILQIGPGNTLQDGLTLMVRDSGEIALAFDSFAKVVTNEGLPSGRMVFHAVVDTTIDRFNDRVRFYANGEQIASRGTACGPGTACGYPFGDATLSIVDHIFSVGNRPSGDRSFRGTLHYAAIYDRALPGSEAASQAAMLATRDD